MMRHVVSAALVALMILPTANAITLTADLGIPHIEVSADDQGVRGHPKITSRLSAATLDAERSPSRILITAYAVEGTSGRELAASLREQGREVHAVGARSLDVLAHPAEIVLMASDDRVAFIDLPIVPESSLFSEGVAAMRADLVHTLDRRGAGVKVAVFDHGFTPTATKLAGRVHGNVTFDGSAIDSGSVVHGNACAEIILDVAPLAELYLVKTVTLTQLEVAFDWAIANNMHVISASLGTTIGPFDGTSDVSRALTRASNAGIKVAVSNGNSANHHWYGPWSDTDGDGYLNFASNDETIHVDMRAGQTLGLTLTWNSFPTTNQDYDLLLFSDSLTLLTSSRSVQSGTQAPREFLSYTTSSARRVHIVIQNWNAAGTATFHLFASHSGPVLGEYIVPARSVTIPADAIGAIAVGAVSTTTGHAYHSYSSQGPTDDGRLRPTISASAGVSTDAYGPSAFLGTSASAPHVAGLLALMVGEQPSLTPAAATDILVATAIDIDTAGADQRTGHGWVDAHAALLRTDQSPPSLANVTFTPAGPLGAGRIDVALNFTDHLLANTSGIIQLEPSQGTPLALTPLSVSNRTITAFTVLPANVTNGAATFRVTGMRDWASNLMIHQDVNTTTVLDTIAPLVDIAPLATPFAASAFNVTWNATDATSGIRNITLERSLDNQSWAPWVASPSSNGSAEWHNISTGDRHHFRLRATDMAGNTNDAAPGSRDILVDLTPPTITSMIPAQGSVLAAVRPEISATLNDAHSGIDPASARIQMGNATVNATYDPTDGRIAFTPIADLLPGVQSIHVTGTDRAGHAAALSWNFTIDPSVPRFSAATLDVAAFSPNADGAQDNATLQFVLESDATVAVEIRNASGASVRAIAVGLVAANTTRNVTWDGRSDNGSNVAEGTYGIFLNATRASGNAASVPLVVAVDLTPPLAPASLAGHAGPGGSAVLTWNATADAAEYIVTRGSTPSTTSPNASIDPSTTVTTSPASIATPADAGWTFQVTTRDAAHNLGPASLVTVITDRIAPETSIVLGAAPDGLAGWYLTPPAPSAIANETGSTFEYRYNSTEPWTPLPANTSPPRAGNHSLEVRATDAAGNVGTPASHRLKYDATPPRLTGLIGDHPPGPDPSWFSLVTNVTATAEDTESNITRVEVYDAGQGQWIAAGRYALSTAGLHDVRARATDEAGRSSGATLLRAGLDTTPPVADLQINSTKPPVGGWYAGAVNVSALGSDTGSGVWSTELTGVDPSGTAISQGNLTRRAGIEGVWNWTNTVTDRAGHVATTSLLVRIDAAAPAASLATPTSATGPSFSIAVALADGNGSGVDPSSLVFSLPATGAQWPSGWQTPIASAVVTGIPAGVQTFRIRGADLVGHTFEHDVNVTVNAPPPPVFAPPPPPPPPPPANPAPIIVPVVTPPPANLPPQLALTVPGTGSPTVALTLVATATDPEGASVSIMWELGDGTNASGASVLHAYPSPGRYTIRVVATDPLGAVAVVTQSITIMPPPPTVQISAESAEGDPLSDGSTILPGALIRVRALTTQYPDDNIAISWTTGGTMDATDGAEKLIRFAGRGPRAVHVLATGQGGAASATFNVEIQDLPPTGAVHVEKLPLEMAFRVVAEVSDPNGDILEVEWGMGDGTTHSGLSVEKQYHQPGRYEGTATVSDGKHTLTIPFEIIVQAPANVELEQTSSATLDRHSLAEEERARAEAAIAEGATAEDLAVPSTGLISILGAACIALAWRSRRRT